jgi:hypothetical protein
MKKITFEWVLFTVGGAILGAIAVDAYRKAKADAAKAKAEAAKPDEIVIIEKL